jgi:hypothetical protein
LHFFETYIHLIVERKKYVEVITMSDQHYRMTRVELREDLDEGTYVAVRAYDPSRTVAELEEEALERFGTMRQRQEDNP